MGKLIQNILDSLRLTDEEDDLDDFEDNEPVARTREVRTREVSKSRETVAAAREPQSSQPPKRFETTRPIRTVQTKQLQPAYEEEDTYEPPKKVTRQTQERQVVPMRSASHGLEVIIKRPTSFDDAQEICDLLKEEHAIIINLERLDHELAQKMMDFIAGAIYALDAKIHQISGRIFCISPEKVDISGDYFNMLSENNGFKVPELLKN